MIHELFPKIPIETMVLATEKGFAEASSSATWLNKYSHFNSGSRFTGTIADVELLDNILYEGEDLCGLFFHHSAIAWGSAMRFELGLKWYSPSAMWNELLFIGDIELGRFLISPKHYVWSESIKGNPSFYNLSQQFLIVAGLSCRGIAEKEAYAKLARDFCVPSLTLLREFVALEREQ
jgi:hypothetical protein